ncbi:aliphatic sulfonates import ATP-binding protein SsuB [Streptomyces tauricus]|uniref:ATP-binding cassette domain-containing protein n=1 Tax=Streptomyces tauricus TaxID=68274 RepID=UPI001675BBBF|nr:ATP-binding cassette domain-containing protein [Streptomyces tauricus]GHA36273.1 aliphatic sulfonates import ATP-binding protein SsuB [Streptomyces tauricus]
MSLSHAPQAVRVEGLTRAFDGRVVIDDLRLDIGQGEFVALVGPRGCGKSTLLRILAGLDRDLRGTVLVPRRKALAALEPHTGPRPRPWNGRRASLARVVAREPDLLLLDDPFGALDARARAKARRLVGELWQRRGCAVLLATSDVEEAVLLADRVLVMDEGVIAYETAVGLDRPRDRTGPRFAALRAELLARLGTEPAA